MTETIKLPKQVQEDNNWRDDIDLDYATYGNEKDEMKYVSPKRISKEAKESIAKIKERNIKIGHFAIFKTYDKMMA